MKFIITIFDNIKDFVFVKNEGEREFTNGRITIPVGQEIQVNSNIAKNCFGDWDKEGVWGEIKRRESLNIHLFNIGIQTKTYQKPTNVNANNETIEKAVKEPEFEGLNEEVKTTTQCRAKTKSGSRCKREALEGSDFCALHKGE